MRTIGHVFHRFFVGESDTPDAESAEEKKIFVFKVDKGLPGCRCDWCPSRQFEAPAPVIARDIQTLVAGYSLFFLTGFNLNSEALFFPQRYCFGGFLPVERKRKLIASLLQPDEAEGKAVFQQPFSHVATVDIKSLGELLHGD